jgi:hypothetical protein
VFIPCLYCKLILIRVLQLLSLNLKYLNTVLVFYRYLLIVLFMLIEAETKVIYNDRYITICKRR